MTAWKSLSTFGSNSPELPRIPALEDLYSFKGGVTFRQGMLMMIVGRSATGKSGFALWLAQHWGLRTLYFSADMSAFTASTRLAGMNLRSTREEVLAMMDGSDIAQRAIRDSLTNTRIQFSFGSPITWQSYDEEMWGFVEEWNAWPDLVVVDNLGDIEGCTTDYVPQMEALQDLTGIGRERGITTMVLHHATDAGTTAQLDPFTPPGRGEIKNKVSEKPELTLSVALNPVGNAFRVAPIKQRDGYCDPSGKSYVTLQARPEFTQYERYDPHRRVNL